MTISGPKYPTKYPKGVPVWGMHSVRAIIKQGVRKVFSFMVTHEDLKKEWPQAQLVQKSVLDHLLPTGAVHQGIVVWTEEQKGKALDDLHPDKGSVLVLDGIVDPQNIGALWRNAAAFGIQGVVLSRNGTPALEGTIAKVACGALEYVPPVWVGNIAQSLRVLQNQGFFCVGLAEEGPTTLNRCDLWPVAIVIGSEEKGLKRIVRQGCDGLFNIQTSACFPTLNASVAGALSMAHFFQKGLNITMHTKG